MSRIVLCVGGALCTADSPNGRNLVNAPDHAELALKTEQDIALIQFPCMAEKIAQENRLKLNRVMWTRVL